MAGGLKRGDHIYVCRYTGSHLYGYDHHGIYCGDGWVIHYHKVENFRIKGTVAKTSLETFSRNSPVYIAEYADWEMGPADSVIQRAEKCVGEGVYSLFKHNCEHFARWCKTGRHISNQVRMLPHRLSQPFLGPLIQKAIRSCHLKFSSSNPNLS
jgi:hypothetical protein